MDNKTPSLSDLGFMSLICKNCSVALLYPHEELHAWLKCESCGFCKKKDLK